MGKWILALLTFALLTIEPTDGDGHQVRCLPTAAMLNAIRLNHKENIRVMGKAPGITMLLMTNERTRKWTLLFARDGSPAVTCLMASGKDFEIVELLSPQY